MSNGKIYVIVTDDGPFHKDCFLTWTTDSGGYYTTVDYIDEVNEFDFYKSVKDAEDRAKDADSGTWGGWQSTMTIMELLNFDDAVNHGEDPDLIPVKTIDFKKEN